MFSMIHDMIARLSFTCGEYDETIKGLNLILVHQAEERNKTDEKIMEATLSNDPAKLKALLTTKKYSTLSRPDDDGRVAYVRIPMSINDATYALL